MLICCFSSLSTSLGDVLSCQRCEEEIEQLRRCQRLVIRDGTEAGRTARSPTGRRHEIKLPVHTFTTRTLPQLASSPPDFQECLVLICSMPERSARSSRRQHGTKLPWRVSPPLYKSSLQRASQGLATSCSEGRMGTRAVSLGLGSKGSGSPPHPSLKSSPAAPSKAEKRNWEGSS